METLEQLQSIIDNAPDGATHISNTKGQIRYLKHNVRREFIYSVNSSWAAFTLKSQYLKYCSDIRSLSDIKRIIGLEKKAG